MKTASFITVLSGICLFLPGAASASGETTIRQIVTLRTGETTNMSGPPSGSERVFTFGDGCLAVKDGDQTLRFDEKAGRLTWTDETHGSRLEVPLPINPQSLLGDVSALRYLEQSPLRLSLERGTEVRRIAGHDCRNYLLTAGPNGMSKGVLWAAADMGAEGARMAALAGSWWRLQFPLAPDGDAAAFEKLSGPVFEYERTESAGGTTIVSRAVCAGVERESSSSGRPAGETGFSPKSRMTYQELLSGRLGPSPAARTEEEKAVLSLLRKFQDGYRSRDLTILDAWIEDLMAPDVFVLGTDGAWPESWEWRGGHPAAREMFERDWRRWGSLKIFEDEMHLSVDGEAAWAAAFATVVRDGSDADASRRRASARLREYAESDWPSLRVLYEAMADAAQVLVQYERDDRFVTPLRVEFGLVKKDGNWKMKMIHFSHPASGFRSFRLLNAPEELVRKQEQP